MKNIDLVLQAVQDYVRKCLEPVASSIKKLEDSFASSVSSLDEKLADIAPLIEQAVAKQIESLPKAKDGEDGRDALDLDILPGIDEDTVYRRGTFASHKGGLWKSYTTTTQMRGWDCVVDGIHSVEIQPIGDRGFSVVVERSTGVIERKDFVFPVILDRGVFKESESYVKGDAVTWGGSLWIAQGDTSTKPDSANSGWRLAVKRGRDGKDGRNGIDKTAPVKVTS